MFFKVERNIQRNQVFSLVLRIERGGDGDHTRLARQLCQPDLEGGETARLSQLSQFFAFEKTALDR